MTIQTLGRRGFRPLLPLLALGCLGSAPQSLVDLEGRSVASLTREGSKAAVFVFTRTDCPISNRYAPDLRDLHERFSNRGVDFWLVYVDPEQDADEIRTHLDEYDYGIGALRDLEHALVDRAGAQVTPEVAVFGSDEELLYLGRIDDRYSGFGQARPRATTRDLERALIDVLDGKRPSPDRTEAVGCYISDLR